MTDTTIQNLLTQQLPGTENSGDQVPTSMEGPKRIGLTMFFLVFVVFGGWASLAPLDGAAQAPGIVTVESYSDVVQHLEGGIISEIMVRNGDVVDAGQPLLKIDDTQSLAELEMSNAQFVALATREARLIAERDELDEVAFPSSLDRGDVRVREEINAQNEIFVARKLLLKEALKYSNNASNNCNPK